LPLPIRHNFNLIELLGFLPHTDLLVVLREPGEVEAPSRGRA
jgi:hypothetical protein